MIDYTVLKDRILWRDGSCTIKPEKYPEFLAQYQAPEKLFVTEITEDIQKYNSLVPKDKQIKLKGELDDVSLDWKLPEPFGSMSDEEVIDFVYTRSKLVHLLQKFSRSDIELRTERMCDELDRFKELKLIPVLRLMIYIVNELNTKNIVWGVGRGSSVASYVLYLIGVHDVDSVKYELSCSEFLR